MVKICGVTTAENAAMVAACGPNFIGLNFWPRSKRYLRPEHAADVRDACAGSKVVGVFVDASDRDIAAAMPLDLVQLHGAYTPSDCARIAAAVGRPVWRALNVATDPDDLDAWPVDAIVLDAAVSGAGAAFDHAIAQRARERFPQVRVVLAGGLTPANVAAAALAVRPWCVDVASGVESSPGVKDRDRVRAFIAAARGTPPA